MRFHGLMLLRDERDIIIQNLTHLLSWIDALYILDLGSTDGTWDVVQDFASRDKRIVPFKRSPIIYTDNLRCVIFDKYRDRFQHGDWIMKIDADEIYHLAPPDFVSQRLRPFDSAVWLQWYFFRLTENEVNAYESGAVDVLTDRKKPIDERRRHYKISEYSEPRMFRYRPAMQWPERISFPYNAGYVSRQRIPIRHYPHRDPLQMETRFRLRAKMMSLNAHAGGHWNLDDWRVEIVNDQGISAKSPENKRGLAGEQGIDTGVLHHWQPGMALLEQPIVNRFPFHTRAVQRLMHPLLLPILDARRPRFDSGYQPAEIPVEIQSALERESKTADPAVA